VRKRLQERTARRALGGAALLAIIAGGAAFALSGSSGEGAVAGTATATGSGKVERRTLAERLTVGGTIGYAGEATVLARLSGTVTSLPKVGDTILRGEQLYALAGEPVLLMYGSVPAYRELAEGVDEGPDVEQLEENLAALGYEPGTVDEGFSATTAAAVSAWQEDLGLKATGAVELGRVAFLPGPRRVTEVEATLGESIGSSGGGGLASYPTPEGATTFVAYEGPAVDEAAKSPAAVEPTEAEKEGKPESENEPKEEEAEEKETPSIESPSASSSQADESPQGSDEGEEVDPASVPVLKTSSTRRIVSVELDPDQQSVARRGQRVTVLLPGGEEAKGEVRRIAAGEGSGEEVPGEETEPGVEVTVSIVGKNRAPALDGAAVSVLFTQQVRKHVLSVPLTALVAVGNQRFAVVAIAGSQRQRIVVTPGLAADGYVEVRGKGLREGMRVETGE
jgi:peptidoglycan hydrolase-like protein with peptidoglycan-binding domain